MGKLIVKSRYAVISNELLNDSNISLKAKGLFAYLQSRTDGWEFSEERITTQVKEGREAVRSAIKELINAGYLEKTVKR